MTERDKKNAVRIALAGGIIKLVSGFLYTIFDVQGVWFVGNSISNLLFWAAFVILFQKDKRAKDMANFFLLLSINDSIDEVFFDNTVFGWNEILFFTLVLIWYIRKLYKCQRLKMQ